MKALKIIFVILTTILTSIILAYISVVITPDNKTGEVYLGLLMITLNLIISWSIINKVEKVIENFRQETIKSTKAGCYTIVETTLDRMKETEYISLIQIKQHIKEDLGPKLVE